MNVKGDHNERWKVVRRGRGTNFEPMDGFFEHANTFGLFWHYFGNVLNILLIVVFKKIVIYYRKESYFAS
jgi:hypothetical protein